MFKKWLGKIEESITRISDRDFEVRRFSPEWFLTGISCLYEAGVHFRYWSFDKGFLQKKSLPCFVISIGNIVAGGAGKTPMAIYVAGLLKEMGKKPVVISRGYKGKNKSDSGIVSDGSRIFMNPENSGDEPYMMAKRKFFPVVVGRDRFKAGKEAMDAFDPDVLVLDDGFQHLKLERDLDILLFDYFRPLGNKRLLPAGRLRESLSGSGKRADAIIFTRSTTKDKIENSIREVLDLYPDCPWFKTFHNPFICARIEGKKPIENEDLSLSLLQGKNVLLFSGIANNESFHHSVTQLGVNVLHHFEFQDHHEYKKSEIAQINSTAGKMNADGILTTEKDWVKIDPSMEWEVDVIVIGIQIEFEHPNKFATFLKDRLGKKRGNYEGNYEG